MSENNAAQPVFGGLMDTATAMMTASQRRLETISNNVANVSTPGFRRQISFSDLVAGTSGEGTAQALRARADLAQGRMTETGNPLDVAIAGEGFFQLRTETGIVYSRQGQFRRNADGIVVNAQGHALQQAGGGDLIVDQGAVEILDDGTVLQEGRPVGRIALFAPGEPQALQPLGGSLFTLDEASTLEVAEPHLKQAMVEASNVILGDEMVAMMAVLREAERGARLAQLYDDLIGRAVTAFGQGGI